MCAAKSRNRLEQRHLRIGQQRRFEFAGIQQQFAVANGIAFTSGAKSLLNDRSKRAFTTATASEIAIIQRAIARIAHARHHMLVLERIMRL